MKKITINVPEGIRYLSDWSEFESLLPKGHIILNKKQTGCGATQHYITNNKPVILCSPRKALLKNKYNQHPDSTYLYRNDDNEYEVKQDLGKISIPEKDSSGVLDFNRKLQNYITGCQIHNTTPKILITYDSLCHVIDALNEISINLDEYTFVVDEFQAIFQDSRFKATTELNFVENLSGVKNVIYLSATPYLEEYLDKLESFKYLPYIELVWPEKMLIKTSVEKIKMKSVTDACSKIIKKYKDGKFEKSKVVCGKIIEAKEAVFFINSVSDICNIIKKCDLKEDEVNVICSHDSKNLSKLKKVGLSYGNIPIKGEDHKMFTFCTRTTFLGADFYSKCAYSYIFADPSVDSLCLDISLDLPQILGRQRLADNPFRHEATLFYKTSKVFEDKNAFLDNIKKKKETTETMLGAYNRMTDEEKMLI